MSELAVIYSSCVKPYEHKPLSDEDIKSILGSNEAVNKVHSSGKYTFEVCVGFHTWISQGSGLERYLGYFCKIPSPVKELHDYIVSCRGDKSSEDSGAGYMVIQEYEGMVVVRVGEGSTYNDLFFTRDDNKLTYRGDLYFVDEGGKIHFGCDKDMPDYVIKAYKDAGYNKGLLSTKATMALRFALASVPAPLSRVEYWEETGTDAPFCVKGISAVSTVNGFRDNVHGEYSLMYLLHKHKTA